MAEKYASCLVCPITFSLFQDPVVAEDGHTYERSAIIKWIQRNDTSPLTREPITIAGLRPNHTVKTLVTEFRKDLSKHNYKFKLGVDIERSQNPFFQTTGKALFEAKWIGNPNGPRIVLLKLYGACAEKEASFYAHLTHHPYIVYTYGLVEHPQQPSNIDSNTFVMLLQEMAPEGSLFNFLEHRSEKYPNNPPSAMLLNEIFNQITDAMVFLSDKGIIHGDLACRNVLVFRIDESEPKKTLVKLTDFGISRGSPIYSKIDAVNTVIDIVPIRSSPPEVLENINNNSSINIYSEKLDMYAMGVLMWEAYSNGKLPWIQYKNESIIREKVINGERLPRPDHCKSDYQWQLILKCMSQKPDDRPTFLELKEQLTESIPLLINSNISNVCVSPSIPENLITTKPEAGKNDESLRSSVCIDETEQLDSTDCHETRPISSSLTDGKVKDRCSFFEKKAGELERSSSINRSKESFHSKLTSSRRSIIEKISPREDLIKLTKWH